MRYTFLLLCLTLGLNLFAQSPQADKLKEILKNQNLEDTAKISYYQQIAQGVVQIAPDSGLKYAKLGLNIAEKANDITNQMIFYKIICIGQSTKGDYTSAKETVIKGISLYKDADQKQALGDLYHNLGIINYRLQDFENSITTYYKSLEISSSLQNNTAFVKTKVSMLSLFVDIKKFDKALQMGNELVDYVKEKMPNDKIVLGKAYQNIGFAYWRSGNLDSAMLNIQKAYSIHKPINHYDGLINELGTFAQYYTIKNQYAKSIEYLNESLSYSNKIGHAETQCRTSILLSENYTKLNDLLKGKIYADSAVAIADRLQLKNLQKAAYDNLAKFSVAQADYEKAYKVRVIADSIQNKIVKTQNIEHAQELDVKYDVKEKEQVISQQKASLKTHKGFNVLLLILGVISLIVGYFIFNYLNKQNLNAKLKAQQLATQLDDAWKRNEDLEEKIEQTTVTVPEITENTSSPTLDELLLILNEKVKIPYTNIQCIESVKNDIYIYGNEATNAIHKIRYRLKDVQLLLPTYFKKVQRSYIVNINYVIKIEKQKSKQIMHLENGMQLSITENLEDILI